MKIPTHQDFQPCLEQPYIAFSDHLPNGVEIVLIEVTAGPSSKPEQRTPFSLLFKGPAAHFLPQGMYSLQNRQLDNWDLFLVPVGHSADGDYRYEAIFN